MRKYFLLTISFLILAFACKDEQVDAKDCDYLEIDNSDDVIGYTLLKKVPGIWNGPVSSSTPLGSYPEWIVDFRPISPSNVSAKNELDELNDIFMSFFIVKHDCKNKIAFRNGGGFAGLERNAYMLIDSVFENNTISYYRFSDPVSNGNRVFSDVIFKSDSMIIEVYTNKYNTLAEPISHMKWKASLKDNSAAQEAISLFDFPQKSIEKDFTNTFNGLNDAVFYSAAQDPFPEEDQPHIGETAVTVTVSNPAVVDVSKKILLIIATEPFFNGFVFNPANLKYRSRYVFVDAGMSANFTFDYMHPGDYFLNAIYDVNGDYNFSSGDYMNSDFDKSFSLSSTGSTTVSINIDLQIP